MAQYVPGNATVAQRSRIGFVNRGLQVRILSVAPEFYQVIELFARWPFLFYLRAFG